MQISNHKVVTLDYVLTDDQGNVIDRSSDGDFAYLHGANNIIPGLENVLTGKTAGDELNVNVSPEDAYGKRNDELNQVVSKDMFDAGSDLAVGMQFHAQSPEGHNIVVTVTDINGDQVSIDGNHPLAGVALNFDVKVVDVRDATPEEISHGHVHGAGGHDH